jgi:hypothetical protein
MIFDRLVEGVLGDESAETETTDGELSLPEDVTPDRVADEVRRAFDRGELSTDRTGFEAESEVLEAVRAAALDYVDHFEALEARLPNADRAERSASQTPAGDDDLRVLIERHTDVLRSIVRGFRDVDELSNDDLLTWIGEYSDTYPALYNLVIMFLSARTTTDQ